MPFRDEKNDGQYPFLISNDICNAKKNYFIKVELVGLCTVLVLYTARVVSQNAAYKSVCVFSFILRPEDQWSCNAHLRSAVHEHYGK